MRSAEVEWRRRRRRSRTQTSTRGASYCLPSKSSGAAYGGEPHQVRIAAAGSNVFEKPKSART